MAEVEKKDKSEKQRITPERRMKFIGFEVFPGKKVKDLFKSDDEKKKWVDEVHARRNKGEIVRSDCKLLEERVTLKERIVMAVASLAMLGALVLPWYSAYTEVVDTTPVVVEEEPPVAAMVDSLDSMTDSLATGDSLAMAATDSAMETVADTTAALAEVTEVTDEGEKTGTSDEAVTPAANVQTHEGEAGEEIITGHIARRRVNREYETLTALGSFGALGSVGSHVFGGGFILLLTGVIMLVYTLLCVVLPALNLYAAFGIKGDKDAVALKMKALLKLNWLPLLLFTAVVLLSFFGGEWSAGTAGAYTSIGNGYSIGVLLKTLSWGVFVALAGSMLVALKGVEI
jgi:hypothetical protein